MDINTDAPVTVDLRIEVAAPLDTVWRLHTDIDNWTTWHPDIGSAVLRGELDVGACSTGRPPDSTSPRPSAS